MPLKESDNRMLQLMDWALRKGSVATNESSYLAMIGFSRTNISNVRTGRQSFNRDHIQKACEVTGANANWIFGLEKNMLRKEDSDPIQRARTALEEIQALMNSKLNSPVKSKKK